jgi:ABC-type transport system involved in multi-copper enzyme maturation permease subunit
VWSAIFYLEFLRTGRRLRLHAVRWLFAAWLLAILLLHLARVYWPRASSVIFTLLLIPQGSIAPAADILVVQLFAVLLLTVPAFTAGAITEEKGLGTLSELLLSGLTPWRIVTGKLASRIGQVALVVIAVLPLLCWFGGLDVVPLFAVIVAAAGVLGSLAGVSLLASVWSRTTSSAVLAAYAGAGLLFAAVRFVGGPLVCLDPLYLLEPALVSRDLASLRDRLFLSGLAWTALTAGCLALAAWRLRPAYVRQFMEGRDPTAARRACRHPPVGDDPVRWKERYVGAVSPLPLPRFLPRWVGVVLVALASVVVSGYTLSLYLPAEATPGYLLTAVRSADFAALWAVVERTTSPGFGYLVQGLAVLLLAALMANLRGAGGISGEREKGTWDALLLAGVPARAMVRGKLLGIVESTYPYLIAYGVPAVLLALLGGPESLLAVLGTLALLWPAMYLSGAVALERSTRYPSPWKATTDSLIVTTLLVAGLVYTPVAFGLQSAMYIGMAGGMLAAGSAAVSWVITVVLLGIGAFLGWLMLRVARDYVRMGANAIKESKGELPDKRYLPSLKIDMKPRRRPPRRRDDDDEARPTSRRRPAD